MLNLFENLDKLEIPETVYIVGSAPGIEETVKRIDKDAFIISLSGTIQFLGDRANLFILIDSGMFEGNTKRSYWGNVWPTKCPSVMRDEVAVACVKAGYEAPTYVFPTFPVLTYADMKIKDGQLRGNATVAGYAAQLAYHCGAKNLIFAGVNLQGNIDFDGHTHRRDPNKPWCQYRIFHLMLQQMLGISAYKFGDSTLKIPAWETKDEA